MEVLAIATGAGHHVAQLAAEGEAALFQINLFWVIVSALNFILFFALIWAFALKPVTAMLNERRSKIEQGLKDAEQARRDLKRVGGMPPGAGHAPLVERDAVDVHDRVLGLRRLHHDLHTRLRRAG